MLESLCITDYAIIDRLEIEFGPGLTVLSGETGAGKSILIGALGLVLGDKGDPGVIRTGAEETVVTAVVDVRAIDDALKWLEEHEIRPEEGRVILRRVVKSNGRGNSYLQSTPVTRLETGEFTSLFVDIHGQHEHQSLLRKATHRELIDRYASIEGEVDEFRLLFGTLQTRRSELEELAGAERERAREQDMLEYAVREIEAAALTVGEEEELEQELLLLSNAEKLLTAMSELHERLAESRGGALSSLRAGMHALREIAAIVGDLSPQLPRLENAFYEVEDVTDIARSYRERVDFSPERLEMCESRLAEIRRLTKKYGAGIAGVLAFRDGARSKLERIGNLDEERARLTSEVEALERRLRSDALELSRRRQAAAKVLEREVTTHLSRLGMAKATFRIHLGRRERSDGKPVYTQYGIDAPEFLISPNEGEPVKPLQEIASGGEISRIMLALKTVLAESDQVGTLVFDEIDVGIGGQVAVAVGDHLADLARTKQVLCITHLPTIAVRADRHFTIGKATRDGRTVTEIGSVEGDERVAEVARMLAGDSGAAVSREHARKLLTESGKL